MLHPKHKIQWLADAIDWSFFENALEPRYTKTGRRAHPIRVMVRGGVLGWDTLRRYRFAIGQRHDAHRPRW